MNVVRRSTLASSSTDTPCDVAACCTISSSTCDEAEILRNSLSYLRPIAAEDPGDADNPSRHRGNVDPVSAAVNVRRSPDRLTKQPGVDSADAYNGLDGAAHADSGPPRVALRRNPARGPGAWSPQPAPVRRLRGVEAFGGAGVKWQLRVTARRRGVPQLHGD